MAPLLAAESKRDISRSTAAEPGPVASSRSPTCRLPARLKQLLGLVNLLLGRAVNENPRRRATTMGWHDDDPTL